MIAPGIVPALCALPPLIGASLLTIVLTVIPPVFTPFPAICSPFAPVLAQFLAVVTPILAAILSLFLAVVAVMARLGIGGRSGGHRTPRDKCDQAGGDNLFSRRILPGVS